MVKRKIIKIDEDVCIGCGDCIPDCPEGAIQLIDGKARIISDLFCDGLGACIGSCPVDAITVEEREAEPYDERRVMENIVKAGPNTIKAHLGHLKSHAQDDFLGEALQYLKERDIAVPDEYKDLGADKKQEAPEFQGCLGMKTMDFRSDPEAGAESSGDGAAIPSQLRQWPIQLHLVSPIASYFKGADVLLAADCVAFTLGNFHPAYLKGKSLAIACSKLDEGREIYVDKIKTMIDTAKINTLTVMIMQVPCCRGMLAIAQEAAGKAGRKIPIKLVVVGIQGEILSEDWV